MGIGDWGLGIGDWGLGIGDWAQSPQSPIPNPQSPIPNINKISDALSLKYNNFFTAANYDTKTLKEDIEKLLSTQYYSKDPRDVFKPIEQNILDIVKQKNPNLQVKVKKARKLPEIKYTKDKYQEADEVEKHVEKEKEKIKEIKNNKMLIKKRSF